MEQDALLAKLLGMGFDTEEIERCQVAMATSSLTVSRKQLNGRLNYRTLKDESEC